MRRIYLLLAVLAISFLSSESIWAARKTPTAVPFGSNQQKVQKIPFTSTAGIDPSKVIDMQKATLSRPSLTYGSLRLYHLQNGSDFGWDWLIGCGTNVNSGSPSPDNTYGVTAQGYLGAHKIDHAPWQLPSAKRAAAGMLANGGVDSGGDFQYLMRLFRACGDTSYANLAKTRFDARRAFFGGSRAWADFIINARTGQSLRNGIIPWDINLILVGAKELSTRYGASYASSADTFAQVIYDSLYSPGGLYTPTDKSVLYWTLGTAGVVEGFTLTGMFTSDRDEARDSLLSFQGATTSGAWDLDTNPGDTSDFQATAYAIMALVAEGSGASLTAATNGALWLEQTQSANGGWCYVDFGNIEVTEVDGEALWAMSLVLGPTMPTFNYFGLAILVSLFLGTGAWFFYSRKRSQTA